MAQTLFTARDGGSSSSEFESLNLATHVGDRAERVAANRKILATLISRRQPIFMDQTHSDVVVEVKESSPAVVSADAMFTSIPGLPLAVLSADCLPILITSEQVVGVIHAGRVGILAGIILKTIEAMKPKTNGKLSALIGPTICEKCYEVDLKMYQSAVDTNPKLATNINLHCLNLLAEARFQLERMGVEVRAVDICTSHSGGYFSYRRDGITGRGAGVVLL